MQNVLDDIVHDAIEEVRLYSNAIQILFSLKQKVFLMNGSQRVAVVVKIMRIIDHLENKKLISKIEDALKEIPDLWSILLQIYDYAKEKNGVD